LLVGSTMQAERDSNTKHPAHINGGEHERITTLARHRKRANVHGRIQRHAALCTFAGSLLADDVCALWSIATGRQTATREAGTMTLCLFRRCVRFQRAWPFVVRWTLPPVDRWRWRLFTGERYTRNARRR